MTPSEIAECLRERSIWAEIGGNKAEAEVCTIAAATIRELEARAERAEKSVAAAQNADAQANGLLRAKLKIATEALERMVALYENDHDPENLKRPQWLVDAIARIKEVG